MRMCRCAGRARLRGRLRAGVAVAARAVSRQEIETCLVKRARRSIHASFWVFHQSARIYDALDAAARGDFAKTCAAMASTLWQLQRCAACFGAARCNPAALHCHWVFNEAQGASEAKPVAAGLMLVTDRARNVVRAFPSRALCVLRSAIGLALQEPRLEPYSSNTTSSRSRRTLPVRPVAASRPLAGSLSEACRPHHIQNPGAKAATQAQRTVTTAETSSVAVFSEGSRACIDPCARSNKNDIISLLHPLLQQCV